VQRNCPGRGIVKGRWYGVNPRYLWPFDTTFYLNTVTFNAAGHSVSGSHNISKQNDRRSQYFEIKWPRGQKIRGVNLFLDTGCPSELTVSKHCSRQIPTSRHAPHLTSRHPDLPRFYWACPKNGLCSCEQFCAVVNRNLCSCKNAVFLCPVFLCPENKTRILSNANNTMKPSRTVTVSHTASQAPL